jgi:hypothetical protein
MSNQQKDEEVSDDVGIQIFLGCRCEFWSKSQFFSDCSIYPGPIFSSAVKFQNSYLLNRWSDVTV